MTNEQKKQIAELGKEIGGPEENDCILILSKESYFWTWVGENVSCVFTESFDTALIRWMDWFEEVLVQFGYYIRHGIEPGGDVAFSVDVKEREIELSEEDDRQTALLEAAKEIKLSDLLEAVEEIKL